MLNYHEDLNVPSLNALTPHASFYYYESLEKALNPSYLTKELTKDLSGKFYLKVFNSYEESEGFELNPLTDKEIIVPSHLELNGIGKPKYTQTTEYDMEAWDDIYAPFTPKRNPTYCYVKKFIINKEDLNKDVIITLNGVESAYYLYLNKEFVGYAESSFNTHEFLLNPYLIEGENTLVIKVLKFSKGSYLEDQDMFRLSGIFRDLYLSFLPKQRIKDISFKTNLTKDYKHGTFNYKIEADLGVTLKIYDGKRLLYVSDLKENQVSLPSLKPYYSDNPHLYTVVLEFAYLKKYYVSFKTGFKKIEKVNNMILYNGKKLFIKGINRHEWSSKNGRSIRLEEIKKDLLQIKKLNINTIRTSHYPNHPYFYELCDKLGIYVIDENNLETHATWFWGQKETGKTIPGDNEEWDKCVMERIIYLYERDKNHPSIISFSLGNEAFGGKVFKKMYQYLKEKDNNYFIHYEGCYHYKKSKNVSDVTSEMYADFKRLESYAKKPSKPYFLCEYSHAMGNSCGNFLKYINYFKTHDFAIGGCIWDFKDQAFLNKGHILYGGDFGEVTKYGEFCGNGIVSLANEPYPKAYEIRYGYEPVSFNFKDKILYITNEYESLSLKHLIFKLRVKKDDGIIEVEKSFNLKVNKTATWDLSNYLTSPYETFISVLAFNKKTKKQIYENAVATFDTVYNLYKHKTVKPIKEKFEVYDYFGSASVKIKDFYVHFNKRLGTLTEIRLGEKVLFKGILEANFYRSLVSNDIGAKEEINSSGFKYAGHNTTGFLTSVEVFDDKVLLKGEQTVYTTPLSFLDLCFEVKYKEVKVSLKYHGNSEGFLPAFGAKLVLDESYHYVDYFGKGPYANYWDRKSGSITSDFKFDINKNIGLNLKPQEDGNHCGVRKAFVHNDKNEGLEFLTDNEFELSALPYSASDLDYVTHKEDLKKIKKTINIILNYHQQGVGGIDSWLNKALDEYLLKAKGEYEFSFTIRGR